MTSSKDLRAVIKHAKSQGWEVRIRKSGHLVFWSPSGAPYFTGSTPSDWRALRKLEADLAKLGYERKGR